MTTMEQVQGDALRTVPAMLAAIARADQLGATVLMQSYFETAFEAGCTVQNAHSLLFTASLHWVRGLSDDLAYHHEMSSEQMVEEMSLRAAEWAGSHA